MAFNCYDKALKIIWQCVFCGHTICSNQIKFIFLFLSGGTHLQQTTTTTCCCPYCHSMLIMMALLCLLCSHPDDHYEFMLHCDMIGIFSDNICFFPPQLSKFCYVKSWSFYAIKYLILLKVFVIFKNSFG